MKPVHTLLSVIALGVAGASFAGGGPYPPELPDAGPALTRAQVKAELQEALRLGLMPNGDGDYPKLAQHEGPTVSRAQVVAELHEALRLGLIPNGEADVPWITPRQAQMIADAGRRAAEQERVLVADDSGVIEATMVLMRLDAPIGAASRAG